MELDYNYVLFDHNKEVFYKLTLTDLFDKPFVRVYNPPMSDKNWFERLLYRFHVSEHFILPFKSIWNKRLFTHKFNNNKPICFLFSSNLFNLNRLGFFNYLRKKYKNCKLVYYCRDLYSIYFRRYKGFDDKWMKETFDVILNYDLKQVIKYNLTFYSDFESMFDLSKYESDNKSDVIFVGAAKGRLNKILDCYNYMTNKGLNCDFYIVGAPEEIKAKYPNIVFSDKWLDYENVLIKIANTKCILEIVQEDSIGYSARAMKAFGYNKKLVTNSPTIRFTRFFDNHDVQVINEANDINISAIKDSNEVNYHYKNEFSPLKVIEFLDLLLTGRTTPEDYYSSWLDLKGYKHFCEKE